MLLSTPSRRPKETTRPGSENLRVPSSCLASGRGAVIPVPLRRKPRDLQYFLARGGLVTSHGRNTVHLDTAHAPCKCTRGSSSDELGADGGAFGATMPEPFASDGDTAGWPRDSEESPAESLSDDATDYNSDECAALSDGESSWGESDHTDDSLEDQDKLAASADQLDHLHAPAEDTSPTALELAIPDGRDVDTFEASALMGALDASVYVLPGASNILRAKATIRHGDGRAAVDTILDSGAGLNLASAEMLRTAADLGLPPTAGHSRKAAPACSPGCCRQVVHLLSDIVWLWVRCGVDQLSPRTAY